MEYGVKIRRGPQWPAPVGGPESRQSNWCRSSTTVWVRHSCLTFRWAMGSSVET